MTDASLRALARAAAASYPPRERFARHFAYGKLTGDPVSSARQRLSRKARVLDWLVGLLAARSMPARRPRLLHGVDLSSRDIERARGMGKPWASCGDMRPARCPSSVIVLLMLHYVDHDARRGSFQRAARALRAGKIAAWPPMPTGARFRITGCTDRLVMRSCGRFDRLVAAGRRMARGAERHGRRRPVPMSAARRSRTCRSRQL